MPHTSNRSAVDIFLDRLLSHSQLGDEEQEAVAALPTSRVEIVAHRDIVRLGTIVDHACLVERGLIGQFGQTETGARQFISVHVPGEMVDLHSLMVPQASAALNALTGSTVLRIPHAPLRDAGFRYPALAAAFWRDCVIHAAIVAQWLVNVGRRDARSRLAHFLCEMGLRYQQLGHAPATRFELPMTQEQLGDALGLTAVHVNRTLMGLRDDGLVAVTRAFVEILDWNGLTATGEFDSGYLQLTNGSRL